MTPVQLKFSVAICTFNGAKRLPDVLEAIANQQGMSYESWEVLLIDNASTDETKHVFEAFKEKHPVLFCRYVYESQPGQAAARLRSFKEATGEWICFVDDDNILDSKYLSSAYKFISRNRRIGALGGKSTPLLSSLPPVWFDSMKSGLAIWDGGDLARQLTIGERSFTAGLIVNTDVAKTVASETWIMNGRTKDFPIGGEDLELCLKISRRGLEIWYLPDLLFEHVIPENRLSQSYLKELVATFGATHLLLYPVYFPRYYNRLLTMLVIIMSALVKLPWFMLLSLLPAKKKWTLRRRAWTYLGVLKYTPYSFKRFMNY